MVQGAGTDNLLVPTVCGHHQSSESKHLQSEMSENLCRKQDVFGERAEEEEVVGT